MGVRRAALFSPHAERGRGCWRRYTVFASIPVFLRWWCLCCEVVCRGACVNRVLTAGAPPAGKESALKVYQRIACR